MLLRSNFRKLLWDEAIKTVAYLLSRIPTSVIDFEVLESVWSKNSVDYSYLQTFGYGGHAHKKLVS